MWFAALFFGLLAGFGQDRLPSATQAQQAADRGRRQFEQSCSSCHGLEATGGSQGPNLVRSSLVRHDNGGDLIGPVIRTGRPGKGMPAVPLQDEQMADVVAFLHARVRQDDLASPRRPGDDFDLKRLLTGNVEAGKTRFQQMCAACHSPTGDLAHIAKKYPAAELQSRFLYPESEKPIPVTIAIGSGQQIEGTLVWQDHFYVGIRDKEGWYHSWPMEQVKVTEHDPLAGHAELLPKYSDADVHNLFAYLESLK